MHQAEPIKSSSTPQQPIKIRHEWYQTQSHVTITIFAKNVKKEEANINIEESSLCVKAFSNGIDYQLDIRLCDKIVPSQSTVTFLTTKIEIKLKKAVESKWGDLEYIGQAPTVYNTPPTLSKPPEKKNWDKIVRTEVGDDKPEGEAALNKVFQDIYGNGTDEQKRAMMKSFVESGGTVLSTNWDDVKKGKVEGSAPKGMEMHKYES